VASTSDAAMMLVTVRLLVSALGIPLTMNLSHFKVSN
jgi:hypothetical protein